MYPKTYKEHLKSIVFPLFGIFLLATTLAADIRLPPGITLPH